MGLGIEEMSSCFQLLDLESGNVMADFARESDAWEALRQMAETYGREELKGLGLLRFENGSPSLIAMDDELVLRATGKVTLPT